MSTANNGIRILPNTTIPTTTKAWAYTRLDATPGDLTFPHLKEIELPLPPVHELKEDEVLVRIEAVGLNYRDLFMGSAKYEIPNPTPLQQSFAGLAKLKPPPLIPCSDSSCTILAAPSTSPFSPGDKAVTHLSPSYRRPTDLAASLGTGLGGSLDGTLRQYAVLTTAELVPMPQNLSKDEAATLSCAGITAWNALFGLSGSGEDLGVGRDEWVLVQGTGGVATFAIVFAKAVGAKVVVTTASEEKKRWLGEELLVDGVVNYRLDPRWGGTARSFTPAGCGFKHVVEVGGPSGFQQSLDAVAVGGVISVVGMLGGVGGEGVGEPGFLEALVKCCVVRGVYAGSREMMEAMCRRIEEWDVKPVVGGVFRWEETKEALRFVGTGGHRGNVVIRVWDGKE